MTYDFKAEARKICPFPNPPKDCASCQAIKQALREAAAAALTQPDVREKLAALCHEQWSGWMKYLFSKCSRMEFGSWIIPRKDVEHWQRQIGLPYARLRDDEKNSDRKEADRIIVVLAASLREGEKK